MVRSVGVPVMGRSKTLQEASTVVVVAVVVTWERPVVTRLQNTRVCAHAQSCFFVVAAAVIVVVLVVLLLLLLLSLVIPMMALCLDAPMCFVLLLMFLETVVVEQ